MSRARLFLCVLVSVLLIALACLLSYVSPFFETYDMCPCAGECIVYKPTGELVYCSGVFYRPDLAILYLCTTGITASFFTTGIVLAAIVFDELIKVKK